MSFLGQLRAGSQIASTVPAEGDVNPYGLAVVPASAGRLTAGHVLVSNFNDKANVQGTGSTIVQVSPAGQTSLFADVARLPAGMACPGGVGLTTALGILPGGWVVVGSLPTTTGGALPGLEPGRVPDRAERPGHPGRDHHQQEHRRPLGPGRDVDRDVGAGVRLQRPGRQHHHQPRDPGDRQLHGGAPRLRPKNLGTTSPPALTSTTVVGSGYPWTADKAALVLAPTGLALGHNGTLYVADTQTNTISAIPQATTRTTAQVATAGLLSAGGALDAPLGMTLAPNGDLIVVNGNNGNAVEITPAGRQLTTRTLVKNGAGDLFGIITMPNGILAVNDGTNALELFRS